MKTQDLMPREKDKVGISKNTYKQKHLILSNLAELYSLYKKKFPQDKIGFSKFASLRPKQCILAGPSGTHAVCVCTYHQNVKLLLNAIPIKETYHDLIKIITCNINNRACMLRLCDNCPPSSMLQTHLEREIEDFDPDETVQYSQWVSTDRMTLIVQINTIRTL